MRRIPAQALHGSGLQVAAVDKVSLFQRVAWAACRSANIDIACKTTSVTMLRLRVSRYNIITWSDGEIQRARGSSAVIMRGGE